VARIYIDNIKSITSTTTNITSINWKIVKVETNGEVVVDELIDDTSFTMEWNPQLKKQDGSWYMEEDNVNFKAYIQFKDVNGKLTQWFTLPNTVCPKP